MWRGVIWPRDSLLSLGEGESREPRERGREGQGLKYPQWDSAWSDWLRSYGSCWLEVGAEGGFKLDLRLDCDPERKDCDPGKQKLKGAVRTETYGHHYCQQSWVHSNSLNAPWYCYMPMWNVVGGCWGSLPSQARELACEADDWLVSQSRYRKQDLLERKERL
jgi:hypothetical protein